MLTKPNGYMLGAKKLNTKHYSLFVMCVLNAQRLVTHVYVRDGESAVAANFTGLPANNRSNLRKAWFKYAQWRRQRIFLAQIERRAKQVRATVVLGCKRRRICGFDKDPIAEVFTLHSLHAPLFVNTDLCPCNLN